MVRASLKERAGCGDRNPAYALHRLTDFSRRAKTPGNRVRPLVRNIGYSVTAGRDRRGTVAEMADARQRWIGWTGLRQGLSEMLAMSGHREQPKQPCPFESGRSH